MAINDYISVIAEQRDNLKNNLKAKNVYIDGCDTFNQLIPKVLDVTVESKTGAQNGVWTPTVTCDSLKISGLRFIPAKMAVCCEDILTKNYTSVTSHINIAILNIELTAKETSLIQNGSTTGIAVDQTGFTADVIVEESNGLYSITLSFEEINKTTETPYYFKANSSHIWCVAEKGWLI